MKKRKFMTPKGIALLLVLAALICCVAGCAGEGGGIVEVPADGEYTYVNPDETKAQPDEGITIDGVLDEAVYQNNNWLYLHNDDGGNNVDIAMTSYYGEKGMYFVYDVTESVPIYVNLSRASYMNSCIEMYFAPSTVTALGQNSLFEVDLLPTGDMVFKKSNGKGGYVNVASTDDIMAYLGTTTKGGEINTEDCYGYCLELFIPWEYLEWIGMDVEAMKDSFVYVDPAHITSNNYTGTDTSVDRYWYFYAQQQGAGFSDVFQYFRFDGTGVLGTVPVTLTGGDHYTIEGDSNVIPGIQTEIVITPENGYALTSILVDGEEAIQNAAYAEDGSVTLTLRSGTEGLTVSAKAEAVAGGSKTLSGKVSLNKNGGDTLEGVLVTYTGPEGEKPVTIDENGSFVLEDLAQGYYVLTVEKEGYSAISRGICLNRDIHTELVLEYDTFYVEKGTAWVLDDQNEGLLRKFGGSGYLMSNDSYNRFTYTVNLKYDAELATQSAIDSFKQQRSGMRILFSNGKYWHIDMLNEGGTYRVQYAKHSGANSVFGWTNVWELTSAQIEKYQSGEGIELKVVREGRYAAVYLDGTLVRVEKLDSEYNACTAQLGIEAWIANRDIMEIPYSIQDNVAIPVAISKFFRPQGKWDITGQYGGALYAWNPTGDTGWINTGESNFRDVAVTVTDKTPDANDFKMATHFEFTNGETFRISLTNSDTGELGVYKIQAMSVNSIIKNWKTYYKLSAEEVAKLQGEGLEYRVAIVDSTAIVYLDNVQVCAIDLSKDLEGNATEIADKPAKIGLRLYGNKNQAVKLPFELGGESEASVIENAAGSQVTVVGDTHTIGETVVLKPTDDGCEFVSLTVDGVEVELTDKTQYSFTATEALHTVDGVCVRVRDWNPKENAGHTWGLEDQTGGVITAPASNADTGWMWTYDNSYRDITLTVSDKTPDAKNFRMGVHADFTNGETFRISLTNADSGALGTYKIQVMGANSIIKNWSTPYELTADEIAKLQGDGIEFRVAFVGTNANVYLDKVQVCSLDLSGGNVSGVPAKLAVRLYGNEGQQTDIDYILGGEPAASIIEKAAGAQVTVVGDSHIIGETVVLKPVDEGCEFVSVKVDGQEVSLTSRDSYSFVTSKELHTVDAVCKRVRDWNPKENAGNTWNAGDQTSGVITSPASTGDTGWMWTYENTYRDITLTVSDKTPDARNFRVGVHMEFTNGKIFRISLTNADSDDLGVYKIESMGANNIIKNWVAYTKLTDAQIARLQSDAGIAFRVAVVGSNANVYLDGQFVCSFDLSAGNIADRTAKIAVRYYGNSGHEDNVEYVLGGEPETVTVTLPTVADGKITADRTAYIIGEKITLTAVPDGGCKAESVKVDGKAVTLTADGTYTFTAEKTSYTVDVSFVRVSDWNPDEVAGHNWDLSEEASGIITSHGKVASGKTEGDTGWMYTYKNTYRDITLQVSDKYPAGKNFRLSVHLDFSNGEKLRLSLTNAAGEEPGVYKIQTMSQNTIIANDWGSPYYLSDAEVAKLQSAEGVEFRLAIVGTDAVILLDDVRVCTIDLSGAAKSIEGIGAKIAVRLYGNNDLDTDVAYTLGGEPETAAIDIAETANGTITVSGTSCIVGEKVTVTVAGNTGYAHDTFTVNGKAAVTDLYGKYTFTAEKENTITGSFAKSLFKSSVSGWLLENQHYGQIAVSYTNNNGNSNWGDFADQYTNIDITLRAREYADTVKPDLTRSAIRFTFENKKVITFSIAKNVSGGNYKYSVQSLSGDNVVAANYDFYVMNAEQIAKFNSAEGIEFRVIRNGTMVDVYLDGVLVVDGFDLTTGSSGITADMKANVTLRRYDDPKIIAQYGIKVSDTLPDPQIIVDPTIANGTFTVDKTTCKMGQTVTVSANGNSGYYYSGLLINGESVQLGWDGTYTFTASKAIYNITGSFAPAMFTRNNANSWNLNNQNLGLLRVESHSSGNAGWIDGTVNTNDVTTVVKDLNPGTNTYSMIYHFTFSNGETFRLRVNHTDKDGVYRIQSMSSSTLFAAWKSRYDFNAEQTAKIKGEGIAFRVIILGTTAYVYLDDVQVCTYDLNSTGKGTGLADATVKVSFRMDGNLNQTVEVPFTFRTTTELP